MNQLPDEIQRRIWSYIYPMNDLVNKNINNYSYGTTVNNAFFFTNYCEKCGEMIEMSKCQFCDCKIYTKCNNCKKCAIYNDICCIKAYNFENNFL